MDDQINKTQETEETSQVKSGGAREIPWSTIAIGLATLLVGLIVGYLARGMVGPEASSARGTETAVAGAVQTRSATNKEVMDLIIAETRHFKGDPNAPITMIEFSDFQCPYCGSWNADAGAKILSEYVDPGKMRFGYFHFVFLGDESQKAAEASECAGDQGKFWEFHDTLFQSQNGENKGAFSEDKIKAMAEKLSLDTAAFNECFDSGKYTDVVNKQVQIARQLGVQSTPSFLVNGTPVVGAQPFEAFKQVIDPLIN
jgi:protein-disulfide isomerase